MGKKDPLVSSSYVLNGTCYSIVPPLFTFILVHMLIRLILLMIIDTLVAIAYFLVLSKLVRVVRKKCIISSSSIEAKYCALLMCKIQGSKWREAWRGGKVKPQA